MPAGIVDLRPEHLEDECSPSTLCLKFCPDPQGYRLFKYVFGPCGTEMNVCVLWLPDELLRMNQLASDTLRRLQETGVKETSSFAYPGGQMGFTASKVWLRDNTLSRTYIDILRQELELYRGSYGHFSTFRYWPSYEEPVGVF